MSKGEKTVIQGGVTLLPFLNAIKPVIGIRKCYLFLTVYLQF